MSELRDDEEFNEIMNEIDKLEEEFNTRSEDSHEQNRFAVQHDEAIMSQLAELPPQKIQSAEDKNEHIPKAVKKENAMSFHIEGDMKLNLNFFFSGKAVDLSITDTGFEIEIDGGMKFSIPVVDKPGLKEVG